MKQSRTLNSHCGLPEQVRILQELRLVSVDCDDFTASVQRPAVTQSEVTHRACKKKKVKNPNIRSKWLLPALSIRSLRKPAHACLGLARYLPAAPGPPPSGRLVGSVWYAEGCLYPASLWTSHPGSRVDLKTPELPWNRVRTQAGDCWWLHRVPEHYYSDSKDHRYQSDVVQLFDHCLNWLIKSTWCVWRGSEAATPGFLTPAPAS